jgi:hypothetical protein
MHKLFDTTWRSTFELVEVPNFEADKAFDVAFQGPYPSPIQLEHATTYTGSPITGAAGVIYVSTPVLFDTDPAKVIGPTVNGTINTPEAAARAGVKRYVLAGSSKAVATNLKKISRHVDAEELKGLGDLDWSLGHRVDIATRMCVHCTHTTTLARISAWYPFMSCEGAICQLDKHLFRR